MDGETIYGSEYAKSNRAACKLCKKNIGMGSLRLAIFVQSPFFDGKVPNWFHFACFFKKKIPTDTNQIKGFDSLRWDDQQKIKSKMGLIVSDLKEESFESDIENKNSEGALTVDSFLVEYSKSARNKCTNCGKRINKDSIRIQIHSDKWYHLACFAECKVDLEFSFDCEKIPGYEDLEPEDQESVLKLIGKPVVKTKSPLTKRKIIDEKIDIKEEPDVKKIRNEVPDKEQLLRIQSEEYWRLKDTLNNEFHKDQFIKDLLVQNNQLISVTGRDNLLDLLADIMYFGPLEKCSECKNGQLIYKGKAYYCTGQFTEWTKCNHRTQEPIRADNFVMKEDLKEEFPFVKHFDFVKRHRLFAQTLEESENQVKTEAKEDVIKATQPLYKMNFTATPKLNRSNPDMKLIIERLGGRFTTGLTEQSVALISNEAQLEKLGKKVLEAQQLDIHVISEKFLDDLCQLPRNKIDALELMNKHNIGSWGSDWKTRIDLCAQFNEALIKSTSENRFKSKSGVDGVMKMKIKGGAIVDPDSGMEDEAHVLCDPKDKKEPLSCVLGMVDIVRGTNSYYKLQVIEHDKYKSKWYVFRAWGRVGTSIGGNKLTDYNKKEEALEEFYSQYLDKTGNEWTDRKVSGKKPNRFYPLEMDYGDEEEDAAKVTMSDKNFISKSELAKPIQDIVKLIFDIETMKRQMKEFEIDLNKMPLGKISSNQIKAAFSILTELTELVDQENKQTQLILDASNRFYTLIPHDFGMRRPTPLDQAQLIKEKAEMLNNLLEIEIAYNILKTDKDANDDDPIDVHFRKLNCGMEVLDRECDEFKRLVQFVAKTHAETHDSYKIIVHDIIKIRRDAEQEPYKKFNTLQNRQLLWHGSRVTNYAGILSQGLRIAPPEAPSTGYMFGKGIYFADMSSKSANYCFANKNNPFGILLLCEVALGEMHELTEAEYITKLPRGKHSTKGVGKTHPDPSEYFVDDNGVITPMGKSVSSGVKNSSLLYNEFIVYNKAQTNNLYNQHFFYNRLFISIVKDTE